MIKFYIKLLHHLLSKLYSKSRQKWICVIVSCLGNMFCLYVLNLSINMRTTFHSYFYSSNQCSHVSIMNFPCISDKNIIENCIQLQIKFYDLISIPDG